MKRVEDMTGPPARAEAAGDGGAGRPDPRGRWDVAIALTGAVLAWLALALVWPSLALAPAQLGGLETAGRPPWYLLAPAVLADLFPAGWIGLVVLLAALAGLPLLGGGPSPGRPGLRRGLVLAGTGLAILLGAIGWWRAW
ncbi:MAG: hypothetical protein ACOZHQ_13765 [Thermodesulfobacteriota bacterium]